MRDSREKGAGMWDQDPPIPDPHDREHCQRAQEKQFLSGYTSITSEAFSVLKYLDATNFVLLGFFTNKDNLLESLGKTTVKEC